MFVTFYFNGKELLRSEAIGYPEYQPGEIIHIDLQATERERRRKPTREFRPAYFKVEKIVHKVTDREEEPLGLDVHLIAVSDAEIDTADGETAIPRRLFKETS